jgi:hypothetical protein
MSDHRRTRTPARPSTDKPASSRRLWTAEQVRALGVTTDLVTAGQILGLSRNTAYRLAHDDAFPVPVLRAGTQYRVPVSGLLTALRIDPAPAGAGGDLTGSGQRSVDVDRQNRCTQRGSADVDQ